MKKEIEEKKEDKKVLELPKKEKLIKVEDNTKKLLITLVVGILIGTIITAIIFLIARPKTPRMIPNIHEYAKTSERVRPNDRRNNFYQKKYSEKKKDTSDSKVEDNTKTDEKETENKS